GRDARRLLGRLREALLAQDAARLLDVTGRLGDGLLTIGQARAGLVAELLHELKAHAWGASSSSIGASSSLAAEPSPGVASPAPRCRSSYRLRPSITASAIAAQKSRMARMASSLPGIL